MVRVRIAVSFSSVRFGIMYKVFGLGFKFGIRLVKDIVAEACLKGLFSCYAFFRPR